MDRRKIALRLIMDRLQLKLDRFVDRLAVQKSIYLLQVLGLDLRYHYSWYLRGPYSPELTRDAFEISEPRNPIHEVAKRYELGPHAIETLDAFTKLAVECRPRDIEQPRWLECLASLHYLVLNTGLADTTFESVFKELVRRKPEFQNEREMVRKAWACLGERRLLEHHDSSSDMAD